MSRRFFTLDVFTDTNLTGNPLAVVLESEGLDDATMQAIAGEFNLSETVFVLPPANNANRAGLRIFTPRHELPFAGHPTVGTAILLATLDEVSDDGSTLVLEEGIGPVSCYVAGNPGELSARFEMPKIPQRVEWPHDPELLAASLGLHPRDIGFGNHETAVWNGGLHYVLVPVKDGKAIRKISVNIGKLDQQQREFDGETADVFVYTNDCTDKGSDIHARMFAPGHGIPEDPATGSAVASLCGQLAVVEMADSEQKNFVIEQGYEMGRPSKIYLDIIRKDGVVTTAGIGGSAVIITEGKLLV